MSVLVTLAFSVIITYSLFSLGEHFVRKRILTRVMPHLRQVDGQIFVDGKFPSSMQFNRRAGTSEVAHVSGSLDGLRYRLTREVRDGRARYHVELDPDSGPFKMDDLYWRSPATETIDEIFVKVTRFIKQLPGKDAPPSGSFRIDLDVARGDNLN